MINIFLPITSYTMLLSEMIVKQQGFDSNNTVLLNPHGFDFDPKLWGKVYTSNIIRVSSVNVFKKIIIKAYYLKELNSFYGTIKPFVENKKEKYDFYYVDLYHVLSNHVFSKQNFNNACIIEDGILNYYTNQNTSLRYVFLKHLYYSMYGLSYKALKNKSHLTGIYLNKVTCQYVTEPNYAVNPKKSRLVSLNSIISEVEFQNDVMLVLGQEPIAMSIITDERYCESVCEMVNILLKYSKNKSKSIIYYKPHPRSKKELVENLMNILNREFSSLGEIKLIENKQPIELIINTILPRLIISYNSTALITIGNMYKERVELHSYQPNDIIKEPNKTINKLFLLKNVIIHETT